MLAVGILDMDQQAGGEDDALAHRRQSYADEKLTGFPRRCGQRFFSFGHRRPIDHEGPVCPAGKSLGRFDGDVQLDLTAAEEVGPTLERLDLHGIVRPSKRWEQAAENQSQKGEGPTSLAS